MSTAIGLSEASHILRELSRFGLQTWGFVIYRTCCYDDNATWERFLERLKKFAHYKIFSKQSTESGTREQEIWDKLAWNVQQDPSLENASPQDIWRRHQDLMQSLYGEYESGFTHQGFAITVDKEALDSVLDARAPDDFDWTTSNAHVNVLDMTFFDIINSPDFDAEEEGIEEGNVGWKKILVMDVYPKLYTRCMNDGWHVIHKFPPAVARLP